MDATDTEPTFQELMAQWDRREMLEYHDALGAFIYLPIFTVKINFGEMDSKCTVTGFRKSHLAIDSRGRPARWIVMIALIVAATLGFVAYATLSMKLSAN